MKPAGCTTIGVDVNVCGPRVKRATNGGKGGPGVRPRRCMPRACLVVFAALASTIEGAVFGAPSAARAMGAPLLVAAAAGVRVTGLDLLQQRALGAQAGSVRDGAALPTPTRALGSLPVTRWSWTHRRLQRRVPVTRAGSTSCGLALTPLYPSARALLTLSGATGRRVAGRRSSSEPTRRRRRRRGGRRRAWRS